MCYFVGVSRFPTILCLLGLLIFIVGVGMMLRFAAGPDQTVMTDPVLSKYAEALRSGEAGRSLFSIYVYTTVLGAGIFGAGLATLIGLSRLR